ncbi:MAG: 3-phosphoshikimate 1-carboxyvinyltransferase [Actinomycetota bacterium]|nr:3-phosphoshikimate 1-carboxyvinyltransferase [Actinomycetota bacterium]
MEDARKVEPAGGVFRTGVQIPGDKSLSHRALVFASLAEDESEITGLAPGRDVATTAAALEQLGLQRAGDRFSPAERISEPFGPVDCANSGTTMRLLSGSLAAAPFRITLTGDASLRSRPMGRLVGPLGALGVELVTQSDGTAPITTGGASLRGADVSIDVASAQVRTAFELAAIQAEGPSSINSPAGYRDHTERWLETFGLGTAGDGTKTQIVPGRIPGARYDIPGDPSSAAYLWASAALVEGAHVVTPGISLNPGRLGFLTILERMGAVVEGDVTGSIHGDPIGSVAVTGRELQAVEVFGDTVAAAIDELPLVAVLAAYAEGITIVREATELRAKESDRIASTTGMIRALGGGAEATEDGFAVIGTGFLDGGTVDAAGDHRIAMSAAVAATASDGPVTILGASAANVSWPTFYETLEAVWSSQ